MSVNNTYVPILLTGDGSEDTFAFGFKIFNNTDLVVVLVDPITFVATSKVLGTDYTVTINTSTVGGTVVFTTAPGDGVYVSIRRAIPITQTTDIPSAGLFREVQIENALDKAILIMQQLDELAQRGILQSPYVTSSVIIFPAPEANKLIGWNADADGLENKVAVDADVAATAAASAATAAAAKDTAVAAKDIAVAAAASVPAVDTSTDLDGASASNAKVPSQLAVKTYVDTRLPSGVIVMWSGTIATIPTGWYLCNGANSTPDLRDRFIVGATSDDSGVAKTNVTGSLTQSGDGQIPAHTHSYTTKASTINSDGDPSGRWSGETLANTGSYGSGTKNIAVYYALAFIMKS